MSNKKTFYLKNMLSQSCIKLIEMAFGLQQHVEVNAVEIGKVVLSYSNEISLATIEKLFLELGFEVIHDPDLEMVEKAKIAAFELIFKASNTSSLIRNSEYVSEKLQLPYDKISRVFSRVTGVKFEKYIILLKIERAKEMIASGDYSISEIAYLMEYSSVQYFSNQFKKIVGVTISTFKSDPNAHRIPINQLI